MKSVVCLFMLLVSTYVRSADYPIELLGNWAMDPEYCPSMEITDKYMLMGTEQSCDIISMTKNKDGSYQIKEKCSSDGGTGIEKTRYSLNGKVLTRAFREYSHEYQRCGMQVAESIASALAQPDLTCVVNQGQAGVTTFSDAMLKNTARSIYDFDGYTFKVLRKFVVNQTQAYEGQLIGANGQIFEDKSFIMADEWMCQ